MISGRILIADDDRDLAAALAIRCRALGLDVEQVFDGQSAIAAIRRARPDLVCLDVEMPGSDGLSVCETLSSLTGCEQLPTIILTGQEDETVVKRCHDLTAYYVPKGSDAWARLEPLLNELLSADEDDSSNHSLPKCDMKNALKRQNDAIDTIFAALGGDQRFLGSGEASKAEPSEAPIDLRPWVLHVEDDPALATAVQLRLEQNGIRVVTANSGVNGVQCAMTRPADAILLDFELPQGSGDFVLRRLKSHPMTANIPVIFLTGRTDPELKRQLTLMGAAAVLTKPIEFERLVAELNSHIAQPAI